MSCITPTEQNLAQLFVNTNADGLVQTLIDALSAHVAVLSPDGCIVAVNEGWRRFAEDNGGKLLNYGLGMDYIQLCAPPDRVLTAIERGGDLAFGEAAALGMRQVLSGKRDRFQLTYPCHSPTEKRWFLLTVSSLPLAGGRGLIAAHENVTTIVQRKEAVTKALIGTVKTVAEIAEVRDPYTAGHQKGVAKIAAAIAGKMGLDEDTVRGIELGAMIHDIGKIGIPSEILNRPGRLSDVEMALVRTHSEIGHNLIADVEFPWPLAEITLQHHERIDGSGYPAGLCGDDICLEARIVAVADVVDAIASHRPYRPSRGLSYANAEVSAGRGCRYDEAVVDAYFSSSVQTLAEDMFGPGEIPAHVMTSVRPGGTAA